VTEPALTAAAAQLVAVAAAEVGSDNRPALMHRLSELVVLAADTAIALTAATNAPSEDKYPQTVDGVIASVEGNKVIWHDTGGNREERKAHAGGDAVSRFAAFQASKLIGQRCKISFGWVRGTGSHGETDIRRLLRVAPASNGQARRPTTVPEQQAADRAVYDEGYRTSQQGVTTQRRDDGATEYRVPTQEPQEPAAAVATDEPCTDMPEALWVAMGLGLKVTVENAGDRITPEEETARRAAISCLTQQQQTALRDWSKPIVSSYVRPATRGEFRAIVAGAQAVYCGRPWPT